MTDTYTKLHGTTTDRFKVGQKNQRVTLTSTSVDAESVSLLDRDSSSFATNSTVFFTAYIVGKGSNVAAFEIKGCYVFGTTSVTGYVVNTFVDSSGFTEPSISFSSLGEMTVTCTGILGDTIDWTALLDLVSI